MPTLYILCGIPGSGKSYFVKTYFPQIQCVSRDNIRFHMLNPNDNYFAHEHQVFKEYVKRIVETLQDGCDVIADATHISPISRKKLITAIDKCITQYHIIFITFDVPLQECRKRNDHRGGLAHVPDDAINRMYANFMPPTNVEDPRCIAVWTIREAIHE